LWGTAPKPALSKTEGPPSERTFSYTEMAIDIAYRSLGFGNFDFPCGPLCPCGERFSLHELQMKNRRTLFLLIVLILAAIYAAHRYVTHTPHVSSTQPHPAPDFNLSQPTGGPSLKLSDYRGKVVLLDFWATWCEPCRAEIPHFVDLQNKYAAQGLQIIGVSMDDSPDPVPAFSKQFKMNYPVVMGNAKIGEQYGGVLGLPIAFLIDRQGQIRKKHIGATEAPVFEKEITDLLAEK